MSICRIALIDFFPPDILRDPSPVTHTRRRARGPFLLCCTRDAASETACAGKLRGRLFQTISGQFWRGRHGTGGAKSAGKEMGVSKRALQELFAFPVARIETISGAPPTVVWVTPTENPIQDAKIPKTTH